MSRHSLTYRLINTSTRLPVDLRLAGRLDEILIVRFPILGWSCREINGIDILLVDELELGQHLSGTDDGDDHFGNIERLGIFMRADGDRRPIIKVSPERIMDAAVRFQEAESIDLSLDLLYPLLLIKVIIHDLGHALMDVSRTGLVVYDPLARSYEHAIEESLCQAFCLVQNFSEVELAVLRIFIGCGPTPYYAGLCWQLNTDTSDIRTKFAQTMISWRDYKLLETDHTLKSIRSGPKGQLPVQRIAAELVGRQMQLVPTAFRTAPEHANIERLEHLPTDKSLQELGISDYYLTTEIDPSGKVKVIVNVRDSVDISGQGLSEISVSFGLIRGDFDCSNNELTSIAGFPSEVYGSVYFCGNKITSLEGLKIRTHRGGVMCGCGSQINHSALGIMLSEGIISADFDFTKPGAFSIINRYLGRPDDIFSCQSELIHADFEEFAQI